MIASLLCSLLLAQGGGVQTRVLLHPGDPMPGRPGEAVMTLTVHAVHRGEVAYGVSSSPGGFPYYRQLQKMPSTGGAPIPVYTEDDLIPGTALTFHTFDPASLYAGTCYVSEKDQHTTVQGIYSGNGGPMRMEVDMTAGIGGFEKVVSADSSHVAFVAKPRWDREDLWIKDLATGTLTRVAGTLDAVPGVAGAWIDSVGEFGKPYLRNGWLVFDAYCLTGAPNYDRFFAVFLYDIAAGTLQTIADLNTDIPGHGTGFDFWAPVTDGRRILFEGRQGMIGFGGWAGAYLWENGVIRTVADMDTEKPDGTGNFYTFMGVYTSFALEGDVIILPDSGPVGLDGVYAKIGDTLVKIVRWGETVPRGGVYRIKMAPECYSKGQIALGISHAFGAADGMYVFDFPVPELHLELVAPLRRGSTTSLAVSGAQPSERIYFTYSLSGTLFEGGLCPPALGGMCLDLLPPVTRLGSAVANASGLASLSVAVPPNAPLIDVWFQAAAPRGAGGADSVKSATLAAAVQP